MSRRSDVLLPQQHGDVRDGEQALPWLQGDRLPTPSKQFPQTAGDFRATFAQDAIITIERCEGWISEKCQLRLGPMADRSPKAQGIRQHCRGTLYQRVEDNAFHPGLRSERGGYHICAALLDRDTSSLLVDRGPPG
jgi:hypothetical protein